ncbi:hypothetical protein T12_16837 [Trichinella patagoniensis]|uniref:Uncharacterized protein n=1 Tax=Trichinella patagoniensis TaxID=990121 RepID=A0A0V0ZQN2_9BILA|nr:hypothetical protein T12_16837 [Trichinella patagoniensis]
MESQLSGQKVSVMLYTCHNSGGQLLKRHQNEMFLTARLFRPGEAAQSKRLRNQPDSLIASRRFRPPDAESGEEKCINKSEEGGGTVTQHTKSHGTRRLSDRLNRFLSCYLTILFLA